MYLTNALKTLIPIDALARRGHLKPIPAVAAVALSGVHTHPILAQVAAQRTLINVLRAYNLLGRRAQQVKLCGAARRARLAQVVRLVGPALAHGAAAAAVDTRQPEGHLVAALAAGREGGVAAPLAAVQATAAVLGGDEAGLADAVEAGVGVDAAAAVTRVAPCLAFVLVNALLLELNYEVNAKRSEHGSWFFEDDTIGLCHEILFLQASFMIGFWSVTIIITVFELSFLNKFLLS